MAAHALTDVLANIPDPRSRPGRVHPLGAESRAAAAERLAARPKEALDLLRPTPHQ